MIFAAGDLEFAAHRLELGCFPYPLPHSANSDLTAPANGSGALQGRDNR